jgi:hypothetical protein
MSRHWFDDRDDAQSLDPDSHTSTTLILILLLMLLVAGGGTGV